MERDILYLGDYCFPVLTDEVKLCGFISNATDFRLFWMISVPCKKTDVVADGVEDCWSPRLYCEAMTFACRNWRDLEGQRYTSTADDEDPPALYLFEYQDVDESDIHFVSRRGNQFEVDWTFICSGWKGRVQTSAIFTDVTIWLNETKDEAQARERLEKDLDMSLFSEPQIVHHPNAGPRFRFTPML